MEKYTMHRSDFLQHHGILGMKWGVRRFQNKNGSLTSAGKKRYAGKSRKQGLKLTDHQKRAIKIGAAVAITGLAAYGGYKLYKSGIISNTGNISRLPGDSGNGDILDAGLGFNKIKSPVSRYENLKASNVDGYDNNCKECTLTYAQRLLNNDDVTANPKSFSGNLHEFVDHYFEDGDKVVRSFDISDGADVEKRAVRNILKNYKDGDVGAINFDIAKRYRKPGVVEKGHAMSWEIENGKVIFSNSQNPDNNISPSDYLRRADRNIEVEFVNYKGLTLKPNMAKKAMRNR